MAGFHLIISLFVCGLGFTGTAGLVFLFHIMPSMAVADGVADPNRHLYMYFHLFYFPLPYIVFAGGAVILYLRKMENIRDLTPGILVAFMLPVLWFLLFTPLASHWKIWLFLPALQISLGILLFSTAPFSRGKRNGSRE